MCSWILEGGVKDLKKKKKNGGKEDQNVKNLQNELKFKDRFQRVENSGIKWKLTKVALARNEEKKEEKRIAETRKKKHVN